MGVITVKMSKLLNEQLVGASLSLSLCGKSWGSDKKIILAYNFAANMKWINFEEKKLNEKNESNGRVIIRVLEIALNYEKIQIDTHVQKHYK